MRCILCRSQAEDHDHLFFQCRLSAQIWQMVKWKGNFSTPQLQWSSLIEWISREWKHKDLTMLSRKLCLAVTVYNIWHERNFRTHNNGHCAIQIKEKIIDHVKQKMSMLKGVQDTIQNRRTSMKWNLPSSIFEKWCGCGWGGVLFVQCTLSLGGSLCMCCILFISNIYKITYQKKLKKDP